MDSRNAIDRERVVARHAIITDKFRDVHPLQVGNGEIAFGIDVTGLQTFCGNTLSTWGWHSEALPDGMTPEERTRTAIDSWGRQRHYLAPVPPGEENLAKWMNDNPHRINLGRLSFVTGSEGDRLDHDEIGNVCQTLDLWNGLISSKFDYKGQPVSVQTCAHPDRDQIAVRVTSPLIDNGDLKVRLDFSYPLGDFSGGADKWMGDWNCPESHSTRKLAITPSRADLEGSIDETNYYVTIECSGPADFDESSLVNHAIDVCVADADTLEFVCAYAVSPLVDLPNFSETRDKSRTSWYTYWMSGAAIDLSGSNDSRWFELERRVVLSQYLMRVNSCGSSPPQESGLVSNGWSGKFHLEMTAWHGTHFLLWDREELLSGWVRWFREVGLPAARREAESEGWQGAKWLKTTDPLGNWEAWDHGPNRVTQNAHPFFFAELFYRAHPTRETLETWQEIVFETATMMANFMFWDDSSQRYLMGPPVMSGSEYVDGFDCYNCTSELNYWAMSLEIAQKWRQRLGMDRHEKWDHILKHLSQPHITGGVYVDSEAYPDVWNKFGDRFLRPAWMEVYGCINGSMIDPAVMEKTYDRVSADLRSGSWNANLWGCDYPMMAMTAARLGRTREAIDWLLLETPLNEYAPNGFCAGDYLPGNGGLLWAVAMMAAGWDGSPELSPPGFPNDGEWDVQCEGLRVGL